MADIKEAIRRLIYKYVVEGADDVLKAQEKITQQTTQTDKASLSLEKTFNTLERKYVDTVRAQQDYEKVQKKVNDAVAQNPALQERANAVLAAAKDKFDGIAAGAGLAGTAATILSKAMSVILGPAGLVGVAMTAVGTAAGYMWSKLADQSAIKTVEQALEEQNRLLKEGKTLIDARASAEARFNAQPPNVTRFENLRNELDLAKKLMEVSEKIQSKVTTPSSLGMPEMGIAPEASSAAAPGLEKARAAIEDLALSIKEGKPRVTEFVDELARIAIANPELAKTTEEIIKMGGPALEQAVFKARALEAALNGVATAAQLAALGYASLAQFQVGNRMESEKAEAMERQALATQQLAAMYPGMTIQGAKQLQQAEQATALATARTPAEKMVVQELITQTNLMGGLLPKEDALRIVAEQRRTAEAAVAVEIEKQITGLDQQYELMKATSKEEEARLKAQHAYQNAIAKGASKEQASKLASATLRNETERAAQAQEKMADSTQRVNGYLLQVNQQAAAYNEALGKALDTAAAIEEKWSNIPLVMASVVRDTLEISVTELPQHKLWTDPNTGKPVQWNPEGYGGLLAAGRYEASMMMDQMRRGLGEGNYTQDAFGQVSPIPGKHSESMQALIDALKKTAEATDGLNATMQNALSPYYSQDPRTTKLGFRAGTKANPDWMMSGASNDNPVGAVTGWTGNQANYPGFASGGSFTVPGGYSSTDNRIVSFAARSGETVSVGTPEAAKSVNIDNRIIIQGNVDDASVDRLKRTQYQQAQRIRGMMSVA